MIHHPAVESTRADHRQQAELLLDAVLAERHAAQVEREQAAAAERRQRLATSTASAQPAEQAQASSEQQGQTSGISSRSISSPSTAAEGTVAPLSALAHAVPDSFRVGLAGPPGAGKSSLIEALGMYLVKQGHKVAVIAVDPSSARSGGSILGDKTRMVELSRHPNAFVRPSPTRGTLGGVAQHTNDVVLLCEGGGYDIVLVETVGLGQSEVVVDTTVDMLLLVVPPAGGDELQGVKKGIVEVADAIVVNKADGDFLPSARHAAAEYRRALQLVRWKHHLWQPQVKLVSALSGSGVEDLWSVAAQFRRVMGESGSMQARRQAQASGWMWQNLEQELVARAHSDSGVTGEAHRLQRLLADGYITPRRAAFKLFEVFCGTLAAEKRDGASNTQKGGSRAAAPTTRSTVANE